MQSHIEAINSAISAKLYYPAVLIALQLPDVCAALENENGETSGAKYKAWCFEYLSHRYELLSGEMIYNLRCGVIHQGIFDHKKLPFEGIVFTLPEEGGNIFHENISNGYLNLDAKTFCEDVCNAVLEWQNKNAGNVFVKRNLKSLFSYYPTGFHPHFVGMPVMA